MQKQLLRYISNEEDSEIDMLDDKTNKLLEKINVLITIVEDDLKILRLL